MNASISRHWLFALVMFGLVMVIIGLAASVTPLAFAGAIIFLFAGALQRAVWSKQSIQRASPGTKRVVTVWRGADAITVRQYEDAGWTLIDNQPISGLGGRIGAKLSFRKD